MVEENSNMAEIQKCLSGVSYPVRKDQLINVARQNNCSDAVIGMLGKLSNKEFRSPVEVSREIGAK
jgi:hypothetical protein